MSMAVLVTGGAGFIGSHVAEALLARGESVVVVDNLNNFYDPQLKRQNLEAIQHPQLKVIIGDLTDADIRARGLEGVDRVIHLAASAGVRPSIEDPAKYVHQNLMVPTLLLESMRTAGISKLVWASSSSVYGDHLETPFKESASVMKPVSPYAATKVGGEALAAWLPTIIFLLSAVISFSTGTSWGTMAIVMPIAIPLVYGTIATPESSEWQQSPILLSAVGGVPAGSIFEISSVRSI